MKFISRVDWRVVKEDNKVLHGLKNLFRRLQFKLVTERLSSRGNEFRFSGRLVNERELRQGSFLGCVCVCVCFCTSAYNTVSSLKRVCLPIRLSAYLPVCSTISFQGAKCLPLAILLLPEDPISSVFLFLSFSENLSRSFLSFSVFSLKSNREALFAVLDSVLLSCVSPRILFPLDIYAKNK